MDQRYQQAQRDIDAHRAAAYGGLAGGNANRELQQQGRALGLESATAQCEPPPTVLVRKHILVSVKAVMTPREEREFLEEFTDKVNKGFRVEQNVRAPRGVELHLVKDEPWTVAELVADIQNQLRGA